MKQLRRNLKARAVKLKKGIPAVAIAMKKKETPVIAKLVAGITVLYALSPIDLIPDFIPILGYLDDVLLLPAMVALTIKLIPEDVFKECCEEAEGLWAKGRPKKWRFAIPVVVIWLLIVGLIVKAIWF